MEAVLECAAVILWIIAFVLVCVYIIRLTLE